ncbi:hypothetical protein Tco_1285554 [Tanacetum coccineum]
MLAIQAEEGEGSGHPSEPQPPPFTAQPTHEEPIPNVTSEPIPNVPDKAVYEEWDDRVKRVITTAASLDAEQASGNINRTQSTTMPNVPLPQGIGAGGSLRKSLVLLGASMPVSNLLGYEEVNISIPSPVVIKDKGKGKMEESEDKQIKRTKLQQEQDRLAQSFTEEEWENIRARVEADEELSRRLQAEERNMYSEVDQAKMLVDLINQRKKYFAAQKAEAKRNKPLTQAQ